jgi:hypothetical protein
VGGRGASSALAGGAKPPRPPPPKPLPKVKLFAAAALPRLAPAADVPTCPFCASAEFAQVTARACLRLVYVHVATCGVARQRRNVRRCKTCNTATCGNTTHELTQVSTCTGRSKQGMFFCEQTGITCDLCADAAHMSCLRAAWNHHLDKPPKAPWFEPPNQR